MERIRKRKIASIGYDQRLKLFGGGPFGAITFKRWAETLGYQADLLSFTGSDSNFLSYFFMKGNETIDSGFDNNGTWDFSIEPINGTTEYTFGITDKFGKESNITISVSYEILILIVPTSSSTTLITTSSSTQNGVSETDQEDLPVNMILFISSMIILTHLKKKKRQK